MSFRKRFKFFIENKKKSHFVSFVKPLKLNILYLLLNLLIKGFLLKNKILCLLFDFSRKMNVLYFRYSMRALYPPKMMIWKEAGERFARFTKYDRSVQSVNSEGFLERGAFYNSFKAGARLYMTFWEIISDVQLLRKMKQFAFAFQRFL